ncbi:MAG TPA: MFS transporter [Nitrososphaeraceae archaeon]|nr:MFS transporter [Nitrososphaeraceae archaeon]
MTEGFKKLNNIMIIKSVQLFRTNNKTSSSWVILGILSSTLLAVMFSETMLLPAIPEIMKDFNIPYNTAIWVFSAYLIVAAVMTPISGRLSDIYGKKKVLLTLLVLYTAGIIAGSFTTSISTLLISRIIQGVGLAAVPVAFSILRDVFPVEKLSIAIGVFSSAYSAGSVLGLLFGASIIQSIGWHATFFLIAPVAAIVTTTIAIFVPSRKQQQQQQKSKGSIDVLDKKKEKKVDIKGGIFLSITITTFLIGLTLLETGSISNSALVLLSFGISSLSLGIFIAIEKRTAFPLIDLTMIKHKIILPSYILLTLTGITMFLIYPTIVQLVRTPQPLGFGGDAIDAGNVQLPFMITFLLFATISSFIINKFGNIKPAIIGGIFVILGTSSLFIFHSTEVEVSANLALMAVGLSLTNIVGWNILVSSSPKEYTGTSVGVGALLFFLGMAIGPALSGIYIEMNQSSISNIDGLFPSKESFNLIFLTAVILSIGSMVNLFILKKRLPHRKLITDL